MAPSSGDRNPLGGVLMDLVSAPCPVRTAAYLVTLRRCPFVCISSKAHYPIKRILAEEAPCVQVGSALSHKVETKSSSCNSPWSQIPCE